MHAPDGFLNAGTAIATGAVSAGSIGVSLRHLRNRFEDRLVPLAGLAAAFVFAAQMVNFPVAAGTTGHLLGGALAAILLGPAMGAVVVTVVIAVQALVFADGGLTALGYNVLNMAVVSAFGGYAVFRLARRLLPRSPGGVIGATAIGAGVSVVLSSMAFSIEWLFGATAPVAFDTVFGAMVGVHLFIGIGEALISAVVVGAVLASRPDLVFGASDLDRSELARDRRVPVRSFLAAGAIVALVVAVVVSQFAGTAPDGLERVAADTGIAAAAQEHLLDGSVFSGYATAGVDNPTLSLAIAGAVGVALAAAVGFGMVMMLRDRSGRTTRGG